MTTFADLATVAQRAATYLETLHTMYDRANDGNEGVRSANYMKVLTASKILPLDAEPLQIIMREHIQQTASTIMRQFRRRTEEVFSRTFGMRPWFQLSDDNGSTDPVAYINGITSVWTNPQETQRAWLTQARQDINLFKRNMLRALRVYSYHNPDRSGLGVTQTTHAYQITVPTNEQGDETWRCIKRILAALSASTALERIEFEEPLNYLIMRDLIKNQRYEVITLAKHQSGPELTMCYGRRYWRLTIGKPIAHDIFKELGILDRVSMLQSTSERRNAEQAVIKLPNLQKFPIKRMKSPKSIITIAYEKYGRHRTPENQGRFMRWLAQVTARSQHVTDTAWEQLNEALWRIRQDYGYGEGKTEHGPITVNMYENSCKITLPNNLVEIMEDAYEEAIETEMSMC